MAVYEFRSGLLASPAMGAEHVRVLGQIPLFADLEVSDLSGIAELASIQHFAAKETVVCQNAPGGDLFVILSGHAKVVASYVGSRDAALGIMGPGEIFGEVSLLDQAPRSATIVALDSCKMLVIGREAFVGFLQQHPQCSIRLLTLLAGRLRRLTARSEEIAFLNVESRLAKRLILLADEHGIAEGQEIRLSVKLSQQEIGDFIGATRESANKQIRAWEQDGIVCQRKGYLVVQDQGRLRTIAAAGMSKILAPPPADGLLGANDGGAES